jgi:excinuclease ABC subunit B
VLDADTEGFLRSATSLIQTIGRAARNPEGEVILYADKVSAAMRAAIEETDRRRGIQVAHNEQHGITPERLKKAVRDVLTDLRAADADPAPETPEDIDDAIARATEAMRAASARLDFEQAALWRDEIAALRRVGYEIRAAGGPAD